MSIENATQFYQVAKTNPALKQQFQAATQSGADDQTLVNMTVDLWKQEGYNFTPEEAVQAITPASNVELSDEQLEAVAGGSLAFSAEEIGRAIDEFVQDVLPPPIDGAIGIPPIGGGIGILS